MPTSPRYQPGLSSPTAPRCRPGSSLPSPRCPPRSSRPRHCRHHRHRRTPPRRRTAPPTLPNEARPRDSFLRAPPPDSRRRVPHSPRSPGRQSVWRVHRRVLLAHRPLVAVRLDDRRDIALGWDREAPETVRQRVARREGRGIDEDLRRLLVPPWPSPHRDGCEGPGTYPAPAEVRVGISDQGLAGGIVVLVGGQLHALPIRASATFSSLVPHDRSPVLEPQISGPE